MPYFIKAVGILFIILINSSSLFSREIYVSKNVDFADQLIEKGATNTAYFILKEELKNKKYSTLDKYKITKLISRCFLKEMDFPHYDEYNTKAYQLIKNKEEIYKAQYYAERVAYFNSLTWADSVKFYGFKMKDILNRNKKDWSKIDIPFCYKMFGATYMYFDFDQNNLKKYKKGKFGIAYHWDQLFNYYDSSIFLMKKYPPRYLSDLALTYRGIGNRYLDMISGYRYYTSKNRFKISKLGWYSFYKSVENYHLANKLLDNSNYTQKVTNYSLLGLAYMCIGKPITAKIFFDSMHKIYDINNPNVKTALNVYLGGLTYERINNLNLPYNNIKNEISIKRLKRILKPWNEYLKSIKSSRYDSFSTSPYFQLYCYYTRRFFETKNQTDANMAVSFLLTDKNGFKITKNKKNQFDKYRFLSARDELNNFDTLTKSEVLKIFNFSNFKKNNFKDIYFIDVKTLKKRLKRDEAILLRNNMEGQYSNYRPVITCDSIYYISSQQEGHSPLNFDFENDNFYRFKIWSFKQYYSKLFNLYKKFPKLKKIYTLWDDDLNYELMITRFKGNSYEDLRFLINKTLFIKIYDISSYFQNQEKSKRNITFLNMNKYSKFSLPFMEQLKPYQFFRCNFYRSNSFSYFQYYLKSKGILHVIGHGEKYSFYTNNLKDKNALVLYQKKDKRLIKKLYINDLVKKDLVILNNCYSGVRVSYPFEFDRGIYLQLMNLGTSSIIVNKDKVDDYVSSQLMKHFYTYLNKGIPVGEALVYAKRKFLQENQNGYANPMYWSPFFAISSRKVIF